MPKAKTAQTSVTNPGTAAAAAPAAAYSGLDMTNVDEMYQAQSPTYINLQNENGGTDDLYEKPDDPGVYAVVSAAETPAQSRTGGRVRARASTGSTDPVSANNLVTSSLYSLFAFKKGESPRVCHSLTVTVKCSPAMPWSGAFTPAMPWPGAFAECTARAALPHVPIDLFWSI